MPENDILKHHGIKGQKWGVRRFQNYDGSLTSLGKARYGYSDSREVRKAQKEYDRTVKKNYRDIHNQAADYMNEVALPKLNQKYKDDYGNPEYQRECEKTFGKALTKACLDLYGERPSGTSLNGKAKSNGNPVPKINRKAQKKYDKSVKKNYVEIYNRAADYMNKVVLPKLNKKYEGDYKNPKYIEEYNTLHNKALTEACIDLLGKRPV